jgi:hypothetical protein
VTVGPTLALTEEDHKRLHDLQGVVRHAMSVLRAMPT